jgi:hypothetical protein
MRPIGIVDTNLAIASGGRRSTSGVSVGPGLRTFERMRRSFSSIVHARTKLRMAALSRRKRRKQASLWEPDKSVGFKCRCGFVRRGRKASIYRIDGEIAANFSHVENGLNSFTAYCEITRADLHPHRRETHATELLCLVAQANKAATATRSDPLGGVPFLRKDVLIQEEGGLTEFGSRLAAGLRISNASELAIRYRRAGLVILGRTTTPELAFNATTENVKDGPTRNPWNVNRSAGGSSGGSTAMVALMGIFVLVFS